MHIRILKIYNVQDNNNQSPQITSELYITDLRGCQIVQLILYFEFVRPFFPENRHIIKLLSPDTLMTSYIPPLSLTRLNKFEGVTSQDSMQTGDAAKQAAQKRRMGQRELIMDFFEKFHEAHENLTELTTFTRDEFFQDSYLAEVLAAGLPADFQSPSDIDMQCLSARSGGRTSNLTPRPEQQGLHLELQMFSNLKSFFMERQIDISDILSTIKQEKRVADRDSATDNASSKAYWELAFLIFTAFYLDHSQNDYLAHFFASRLQQNILKFKIALDVVQSLLSKAEITATSQNLDDSRQDANASANISMELGGDSANNSVNHGVFGVDTSNWDPFADADKFEELARKVEEQKKREMQAQFDIIMQADNEEKQRLEEMSKTEDLEASISFAEQKLAQKEQQLRHREHVEGQLLDEKDKLTAELAERNEEIARMQEQMAAQQVAIAKERVAAKEMLNLLSRLQNVAADNQQLKGEMKTKEARILKLEMDKQRLWDENRVSRAGGTLDPDIGGQLSFRAQESEEPKRKKRKKILEPHAGAPQIELTQTKVTGYHGLAQSDLSVGETPYKREAASSGSDDDEAEMTMQQELTMLGDSEGLGGTFVGDDEMHGGRGMSGEEYFETHPNDTSYEIDNTNRDLVGAAALPVDMMSPDVSMMHDADIKPRRKGAGGSFISSKSTAHGVDTEAGADQGDYEHLQAEFEAEKLEKNQYRRQFFELQERLHHYERMKEEYESLYTQFLVRTIKAERDKMALQRRLARVNYILSGVSRLSCSQACVKSWLDYREFTKMRCLILFTILFFLVLVICLLAV